MRIDLVFTDVIPTQSEALTEPMPEYCAQIRFCIRARHQGMGSGRSCAPRRNDDGGDYVKPRRAD